MAHLTPEGRQELMDQTTWTPERKIVAAAIAAVLLVAVQLAFPSLDLPPGVEGSIAVIVGYFMPNKKA